MKLIISALFAKKKTILTSATKGVEIPKFVGLNAPTIINFLKESTTKLKTQVLLSPSKDKVETLINLLKQLEGQSGIVFCNYKDSIERLSEHLSKNNLSHAKYYGGLEQNEREKALLMFRNGSYKIIIATDLAARGIHVPDLNFIIHYQMPQREEEFIHRNGRTARMKANGTAYIIQGNGESLPDFVKNAESFNLNKAEQKKSKQWSTLYISAGKKDKISKGDVVGFMIKEGKLTPEDLGLIEVQGNSCFIAVESSKVESTANSLNLKKLKKTKVKVYPL